MAICYSTLDLSYITFAYSPSTRQMQSQISDSIESERFELLEKIHKLESNELTDSNTALRDLKSRYNELIEATTQSIQYLEYFPTEIWVHVFLRITEVNWMDILPLMQVCQRWTSIILSEPRIWTSVYIQSNVESLELAYSALHLSRDLPLHVTAEVPMDPNIQRTLIGREASRIQSIRLEKPIHSFMSGETFVKISADVLKDLGRLPSLHSLSFNLEPEGDDIWSPILKNLDAPQIRYLGPAVFSQDVLETSRYSRLQDLGTSSSLEVILPKLVKLTDLRRLTLLARTKLDEPTPPSEVSVDPCKDIAPLKSLGHFQEYSEVIWPLLKHVSSSLCVLELEIAQQQLPKLFTVVQDAQYLQDLSLRILISLSTGRWQGNRWKAPTLPRIRRFSLVITIDKVIGRLQTSFAEAAHLVLETLDQSFPHVRSLHLRPYIYGNDLVRLVETKEDLTSLDLTTVVEKDRTGRATCPRLETLRAKNQNVLYYLSMPNLISMEFTNQKLITEKASEPIDCSFASSVQSIIMHSEDASTILANGGEFTQLRTLEWYSCHYGYNYRDNSLPSLTNIIFSSSDRPQSGTAFCESLLRYPRSCPRLEQICFWECLEWDMLLYMLLRRNVHLIQTNISRISRIEMRGYPAPFILVPLSTLLLGEIPIEMPGPEELSFMEIQGIYFDRTMYVKSTLTRIVTNRMEFVLTIRSGCESCIHSRVVCDRPIHSSLEYLTFYGDGENDMTARSKIPKGSDPPLPRQLRAWVDGWTDRRRLWTERESITLDGPFLRRRYCERRQRLVIIDGYTLDGVYSKSFL
jgi:hypothetical protein